MSEELLDTDMEALLGGILSRVKDAGPGALAATCPALRADEAECSGGVHILRDGTEWAAPFRDAKTGEDVRISFDKRPASRRCPMRFYHDERKRLSAQLAACGIPAERDMSAGDISSVLLRAIDQHRNVIGLKPALRSTKEVLLAGWPGSGHVAIVGTVGTAKTHLLLALYFAALQAGVSSWWLTSDDLRRVAKDRDSFDDETQDRAATALRGWQQRRLLVIDDIGDRLSEQRARDPGSSRVSALLLDLMNGATARLIWSSNLDEPKLAVHPDIGPRATSRLFADHKETACRVLTLGGEDQRQHAMRTAP